MALNFHSTVVQLLLILAFPILRAWAITLNVDDQHSIRSAAATVAYGLSALYNGNQTGGVLGKFPYPPYYWWESGAAWGALINYWHFTGDASYNDMTYKALVSQISPTNDFMPQTEVFDLGNDDEAFWVFAALSASEYGFPEPPAPYPTWLTISENAFNDYISRWDTDTCNGGLRWQIYSQNSGYTYKNSISNGGFFQVSARLARLTGNQTYVDWANKAWDWTTAVGLMDDKYNVYDGTDSTQNCTSVDHLQWTYNVGVYLYGAAVMLNYTKASDEWIQRTNGLLQAAGSFISPFSNATNILFEAECEEARVCDTDQIGMKGYLARWLAGTAMMAPTTAGQVGTILRASAIGAAAACSGGADGSTCGQKWYINGWDGSSGMGQQLAALESLYTLLVNSTSPPSTVTPGTTGSTSSSSSSVSQSTSTSSKGTSSKFLWTTNAASLGVTSSTSVATLAVTNGSSSVAPSTSSSYLSASMLYSNSSAPNLTSTSTSAALSVSGPTSLVAASTTSSGGWNGQGNVTAAPLTAGTLLASGANEMGKDLLLCSMTILIPFLFL